MKIKKDELKKKSKDDKKKKRNRNTYFCVGVCDTWNLRNSINGTVPIHTTIKRLRDKHDLKWLRISMSYHKFSNLGEIFQGDLNNKLMMNFTSKDFMDLKCNCTNATTIDGNCVCNGDCRKSIVIYKATCKECGCYYLGNTQQKLKLRMNQHFADTKDLVNNDKFSDSFAKHFASHFKNNNGNNISRGDVRNIAKVEIMWQGNPISSVKTFRNLNCSLCARERLEIHKAMKHEKANNTNFLINSSNELHGGCRHNPKFHRFCYVCPKSADEAIAAEKLENG